VALAPEAALVVDQQVRRIVDVDLEVAVFEVEDNDVVAGALSHGVLEEPAGDELGCVEATADNHIRFTE